MQKDSSSWKWFKIRHDLPKALEREFIAYKDIACIDRIQASAWIGFALTLCMLFGLDIYRYYIKGFEEGGDKFYLPLFFFHLIGLFFIIPAIHIHLHKEWIIQTRLRRGVVIWGMVFLIITFLLGQAVLVYLDRGTLVMFLGYIFIASWMFAMSNTERLLFVVGSFLIMAIVIFYFKQDLRTVDRISNFLEITFLSITAFMFDAFDFNLNLNNFMAVREIEHERERIKRLEEFKSRFFTNLTHELRTPLTMISGMAREIAEDPRRWANEGSEIISRNSGNLLNLVNQILALSKVESGSLTVHMTQGDIVAYLGYVVDAFRGHALAKRIKLHFLSEETEIIMDYDPEKYMTILSNLISNAIKFTPEEGNIYISLSPRTTGENTWLELTVKDTGIGIPQAEVDHIFERFYQAQNELTGSGIGTGIGLSLVYELVKILEGDIQVKSTIDKGTTFILALPLRKVAVNEGSTMLKEEIRNNVHFFITPVSQNEALNVPEDLEEKPEILIIEDNPDVVKYLQVCLGDLYRITNCSDGVTGLSKAIEMVPELILSDVLMPGKDGLAVCRQLKHHPVTNHIPIVLLSAKVDAESRIAGLESGADVYMTKPFEKQELRMQFHNLLERREMLHARYIDPSINVEEPQGKVETPEDPFVTKARTIVLDHLDDSDFSVTLLYRALYLSRTQVHKKLKALTGMSATHFIRHIRLSQARELLKKQDLNITEIAYQVGFSDPNYFTRCYGEEFGESPSETRNHKNNS